MLWVGGRSKEIAVNNLGAHCKTFILFGAKMCLCIPEGGDRAAAVTTLMLRCEQTCPQVELEALPAFGRPYAIFLDVLVLLLIQCVYPLCNRAAQDNRDCISAGADALCVGLGRVLCLPEATHNSFLTADSKWKSSYFWAKLMNAKIIALNLLEISLK